jgi:hypothetical protein
MHAVIVTVAVEPGPSPEEMRTGVEERVIPRVSQAPGALAGHWFEPDAQGRGMSIILFDSRENAEAAAAGVPEHPAPGVTRLSVEVRERFTGF